MYLRYRPTLHACSLSMYIKFIQHCC